MSPGTPAASHGGFTNGFLDVQDLYLERLRRTDCAMDRARNCLWSPDILEWAAMVYNKPRLNPLS